MSFYSGSDDNFDKKLLKFEPDNIIQKCKSNNFSLSNEINETTKALEAMDYVLQSPLGSLPNCFQQLPPNVYNTINIQNNYHHHYYNTTNSQNTISQFTNKTNKSNKTTKTNNKHSGKLNSNKSRQKSKPDNTNNKNSSIKNGNNINVNNNINKNDKMNNIKKNKVKTVNNNVKKLYNTAYINDLKVILNKVLSYQLVTDFYNYNKKGNCSKCNIVTFHPVKICNSCQNNLCIYCFYQLFSGLKTTEGKNNYHNSKNNNCSSFKEFLKTMSQEITCFKCKKESVFVELAKKMDNIIRNNKLDNKLFYKWKKLSDMKYFEKDTWSLIKNNYHNDCQNINKDKINNYSFSISYHPKKDIFTILLNPHLLKLYNVYDSNNTINKIELYYPYQNYLFVDTVYQGLEKLMLQCKLQCLNDNNINELINKWNSYCQKFNELLIKYKNQQKNYSCNSDLTEIVI